ncbi:MAG: hypothetical protein GXY83_17640, partial [Rhodopirellula sp.]|nr:hypothetical protein [Rhodopirellula sp.]
SVDGFETIEFANKDHLVIDGLAGDDVVNLNNSGTAAVGLLDITVDGSDPTASDLVIINGTTANNAITVDLLTNDGARIAGAQPVPVIVDTAEHLTINGRGGTDALTVVTPAGVHVVYVADDGPMADTGEIEVRQSLALGGQTLLPMNFLGLGTGGSLNLADISGTRVDAATISSRDAANASDVFAVSGVTGTVVLDEISGGATNAQMVVINTPGVLNLALHALVGDDVFNVAGNHPFANVLVNGGDPSGSDVLNFLGAGDDIVVDLAARTVTEDAFGPVEFIGIERTNIAAAGAALTVNATAEDDEITYRPTGPQAGQFQNAGDNTLFTFTAVAGAFTINGLTEDADHVIVEGTNSHDVIYVDSPARTVTVENISGVDLKPVVLGATVEAVTVKARLGNDTILVVPAAGLAPAPLNNLRVNVDGGGPSASDALVIAADVSGTPLDNATHFVVINHSRREDEGVVRIFRDTPGIGNDPTQLPDISFVDVEIVSPLLAGVDPVTGEPNLLILGPDLYEQNEFRTTAAYIGSGSALNVTNLAIFPNATEHPFVPADNDFFRFVA